MVATPLAALIGHAQSRAEAVAFVHGEEGWTYDRLAKESARLARGLLARGIGKGDHIVLHLANMPELVLAYYGCFRIGAIAVPLDVRLKSTELAELLQHLRPALYIGQLEFYARVANLDSTLLPLDGRFVVGSPIHPVIDRLAQRWTALFGDAGSAPIAIEPDRLEPAVLFAAAGTVEAKWVIHTQESLAAAASRSYPGFADGQIVSEALPMVHVDGLFTFLAAAHFGIPVLLSDRFEVRPVLDAATRAAASR